MLYSRMAILHISNLVTKTSDKVCQEVLDKLAVYGLCTKLCLWFQNFISISMDSITSETYPVNADVLLPQVSVLSSSLVWLSIGNLLTN